jgi:hypothetical protein
MSRILQRSTSASLLDHQTEHMTKTGAFLLALKTQILKVKEFSILTEG